jgi:ketosteroid isomerase-like protein
MSAASDYPRRAEAAFNARDLDALAALWADDFVYEGPGGERTTTRAQARERELGLWAAYPDLKADLSRHVVDGDRLVIEGRMRGTHAATGRAVELGFAGSFTFVAGRVAHERVIYDRLDLLQQLGAA